MRAREVNRVRAKLVPADPACPLDDDLELIDLVEMRARDAIRVVLNDESLRRTCLAGLDERPAVQRSAFELAADQRSLNVFQCDSDWHLALLRK